MVNRRRLAVVVGVLAAVVVAAAVVLRSVFATLFFAVTVAYVLYPVRQFLSRRGLGARSAAAASTTLAFVAVILLLLPLGAALYARREALFAFFRQAPEEFTLTLGPVTTTVEVEAIVAQAEAVAADLLPTLASLVPALVFKMFLFTLVVYALLVRPDRTGAALLRPVPPEYRDIVVAFHERTRSMLYGIYVLQAAVAAATFAVAVVVFYLLGYQSWFTLSVLSGILQFIPILGPSVLVLALGATEVLGGNLTQAVSVLVLGLVVVGFLPDVVVRPRLAHIATDIPASLYFIGFTGGTLSVGLIGVVAGPVVVAWLAEGVSLLSTETNGRDTTVSEWAGGGAETADAPVDPPDAEEAE